AFGHTGGYLPFTVDLTDHVRYGDPSAEIILRVSDMTERSYHARGKQLLKKGGMFYTAQSGIWQSVWMECTPKRYIKRYRIKPDPGTGLVHMDIFLNAGAEDPGSFFSCERDVKVFVKEPYIDPVNELDAEACKNIDTEPGSDEEHALCDKDYDMLDRLGIGDISVRITGAGIKNNRISLDLRIKDRRLWSPTEPNLYYFRLKLFTDEVCGYFAFRSVSVEKPERYPGKMHDPDKDQKENLIEKIEDELRNHPRICLNHAPYFQKGVLDQGYWPEGLYTPPSDRAFLYDILKMKELGFNMLRKHIKTEPERYYYHCDRTGMLVWQDMVNGGGVYKPWFVTYLPTVLNMLRYRLFDNCYRLLSREDIRGRREFEREMKSTVKHLYNHPSIVTWVIFNEGWGQFDAKRLTRELKKCDDSRIVDSVSGWFDQECGDIRSQHYYFLKLRVQWCFHRATAISEFGGFPLRIKDHCMYDKVYGYHYCKTSDELKNRYSKLMSHTIEPEINKGLSATIYTQLSDVEEEVNGILTYDRDICKLEEV
nr:glycoside hydrolase family 2 [Lachnospiraceae bacterium]